jgi:hypothetical protein
MTGLLPIGGTPRGTSPSAAADGGMIGGIRVVGSDQHEGAYSMTQDFLHSASQLEGRRVSFERTRVTRASSDMD